MLHLVSKLYGSSLESFSMTVNVWIMFKSSSLASGAKAEKIIVMWCIQQITGTEVCFICLHSLKNVILDKGQLNKWGWLKPKENRVHRWEEAAGWTTLTWINSGIHGDKHTENLANTHTRELIDDSFSLTADYIYESGEEPTADTNQDRWYNTTTNLS